MSPQMDHCYPGNMVINDEHSKCNKGCDYMKHTASAVDLTGNLDTDEMENLNKYN